MTIDEFLERLSRTPRTWRVMMTNGKLRTHDFMDWPLAHCPISALTGVWEDVNLPIDAGVRLGLSRNDAANLVIAADNTLDNDNPLRLLRQQLECACGLTNEVQEDV